MGKITIPIDGTAAACQCTPVPVGAGPNGNTVYPHGTCPHFRQYPSGNDPVCLIFQKDARTPRSLTLVDIAQKGLTNRLPECLKAEAAAGARGQIELEIVAGEHLCEVKAVIKIDKDDPDPWINAQIGYETLYYPDMVCNHYVSFTNGSSWCRIFHQPLHRDSEGYTRRRPACLGANKG